MQLLYTRITNFSPRGTISMAIKTGFLLFCTTFLIFFSSYDGAHCQGTGYTEVTAPEARKLQEENNKALIINVLSQLEFELQQIPGSINIPINTFAETTLLPKDKNTPILTYCMEVR